MPAFKEILKNNLKYFDNFFGHILISTAEMCSNNCFQLCVLAVAAALTLATQGTCNYIFCNGSLGGDMQKNS